MVSVVITTCKRPCEMVLRAVKSVQNQTYTDWELFVIDDTPPQFEENRDQVRQMISSLDDSRIQYVQNQENMGACYSRNVGLSKAKGEFIAYLDDDDEWFPEKISEQLNIFNESNSSVALVYCGGIIVDDVTGKSSEEKKTYMKGDVFYPLLANNFIGSTSIPLIRTGVLREVGGFDEQMPASQDLDVWLRIARNYEVDYVEKPLFYYHEHLGEYITASIEKKIIARKRIEEKWGHELDTHPDIKYVRMMRMASAYAMTRQTKLSLRTWREAVSLKPFSIYKNTRKLLVICYYTIFKKSQ